MIDAVTGSHMCRENRTTGRAGLQQANRELDSRFHTDNPAAGVDHEYGALQAFSLEATNQAI
ncbi:hypothetical protein D3C80_1751010 [compost metagenome]